MLFWTLREEALEALRIKRGREPWWITWIFKLFSAKILWLWCYFTVTRFVHFLAVKPFAVIVQKFLDYLSPNCQAALKYQKRLIMLYEIINIICKCIGDIDNMPAGTSNKNGEVFFANRGATAKILPCYLKETWEESWFWDMKHFLCGCFQSCGIQLVFCSL